MTPASLAAEALAGWRRAAGRALHAPGCGCCGGRAIRLNPAWLAEDIDHALRIRHGNDPALVALLDSAPPDFAALLTALAADGSAAATRLLQDIIAILGTIAPRPTFAADGGLGANRGGG